MPCTNCCDNITWLWILQLAIFSRRLFSASGMSVWYSLTGLKWAVITCLSCDILNWKHWTHKELRASPLSHLINMHFIERRKLNVITQKTKKADLSLSYWPNVTYIIQPIEVLICCVWVIVKFSQANFKSTFVDKACLHKRIHHSYLIKWSLLQKWNRYELHSVWSFVCNWRRWALWKKTIYLPAAV